MSNLTVAGKVKDWCKSCQNCHTIKKTDSGMEYICSDPYDGMEKTLNGDSNVTCSMYEARPNPTHVCYEQEVKVVKPGEKVDIPCTKISLLEHELEMDRLRREKHQLEKEKVAHMKGIERLKKSQEKLQNQIKNLQTTNEESYKREDELEKENKELRSLNKKQYDMLQDMTSQISELKLKVELNKSRSELISELIKQRDSWKADYNRLNDYFLKPICEIVYGDEKADIDLCTGLIGRIKNLKVQSDENGTMYEDLKMWEEKYAKLFKEIKTQDKRISDLWWSLHRENQRHVELNNTVEEQDMTIKALLLTIKEICKEDETNA